jgi:hypothetical protein
MAEQTISRLLSVPCIAALLLFAGCQTREGDTGVDLEPNDPRPILSIVVGDADEAMLLVQRFELEVLRMDGPTVFFFDREGLLPDLADLGYEPAPRNPHNVFRRVVRIDRAIPEEELIANGVRVINREDQYLVVEAAIGQLRALVRGGSEIQSVSTDEPRPRGVRIFVSGVKDVAAIGAMEIDIHSVETDRRDPNFSRTDSREFRIVVYAGAFDFQIDALREAGYEVEILE